MAEAGATNLWLNRGVFILFAFVLIVIQLVPLDARPPVWAAPDVLLAMALVWAARRPDYLPVYVIAAVFLITDLLFQRPPGLWAALVVILTENLRKRAREFRSLPLLVEWGSVALGIVMITLANRLILAIVMTPQAPLGLTLSQMVLTILIYPLCVFIAHALFRVGRPGAVDIGRGLRL